MVSVPYLFNRYLGVSSRIDHAETDIDRAKTTVYSLEADTLNVTDRFHGCLHGNLAYARFFQ